MATDHSKDSPAPLNPAALAARAAASVEPPKLYDELAAWWPVLSPPEDYAEEAAFFERLLVEGCDEPPRTLLELGSGGGNNASFLKRRFAMTLVDRAPGMLAVSRSLNPECEHVEGDLQTVRLDRVFDGVFLHDAIAYMTTEAALRQAFETAWVHCRPGGVVVVAPDYVRERFEPSSDNGGSDAADGRGLRYLEWVWDPDPDDTTYVVDYAYLLREPDGTTRVEHDRHIEGLFPRATWLRLLETVGFEAEVVRFDPSDGDVLTLEIFVARRPA